jgi:hypothetical protein
MKTSRSIITYEIESRAAGSKQWAIVDRGSNPADAHTLYIMYKASNSRMKRKRFTRLIRRIMTIDEEVLETDEHSIQDPLPES